MRDNPHSSRLKAAPTALLGQVIYQEEYIMDAHFIFGLVLILFTLGLCFYFRNENKNK